MKYQIALSSGSEKAYSIYFKRGIYTRAELHQHTHTHTRAQKLKPKHECLLYHFSINL